MKVQRIAKRHSAPSRPASKRVKLIRNTLAEEIEIRRGIAADPDARELTRGEIRRMRPFAELLIGRELGGKFANMRAPDYLVSDERETRYLKAAAAAAEKFGHASVRAFAERAVAEARTRRKVKP